MIEKKVFVDFHCHTVHSPDSLNNVRRLIAISKQRGIDRLVITDHNTIQGALLAKDIAPEHIIVGEEIETSDGGEVLAAYVTEEIPGFIPFREVIARLKEQGAFISLSHPFDYRRKGWQSETLHHLTSVIDAIEVFNSRVTSPGINQKAKLFARQNGLPGTAGSDAHTLREVGRARVCLPEFQDADQLRNVIMEGVIEGVVSSPFIHLASRYAMWYKRLKKVL